MPDVRNIAHSDIFLHGGIELGKSLEHSGDVLMVFSGMVSPDVVVVYEEITFIKLCNAQENIS